jgi:hypothetical protein
VLKARGVRSLGLGGPRSIGSGAATLVEGDALDAPRASTA